MFNPWNSPNVGYMGDPNSRFPIMPSWGQFYPGQNWANPGAPMPYGFNPAQPSMIPPAYAGGFSGYVPQTQPPPPPPSNEKPPPPPSSQASSSNNNKSFQPGQQQPDNNHLGNPQLREIIAEEQKFNQQYKEWKIQCDTWMEANKNHPDREQFLKYEQQNKQHEKDMLEKQSKLRQRKEQIMKAIQPPPPPPPKPTPLQASIGGAPHRPSWQGHDVRPPLPQRNQTPMNVPQPQRWNHPGGKGDQVNFGPDINQRFQSDQHQFHQQQFHHQQQQQHRPPLLQHQPSQQNPLHPPRQQHHGGQPPRQSPLLGRPPAPQNDMQRWQAPQRPLLEMPPEAQGPPRLPGNRFPLNLQGGPRMGGNIVFRPSDQNQQHPPPQFRSQGPNNMPQDKHTPVSKNMIGSHAPVNSQPSGQPAHNPSMPQGKGPLLDAPSRFAAPRRPLLPSHANDFEPDRKRSRMNMPAVQERPQPDISHSYSSPKKGFLGPIRPMGVHRPSFNSPPSNRSDFKPRLQMMGPRFRRQGAAAIAQEFQTGSECHESIKIELLKPCPSTSPLEPQEKAEEETNSIEVIQSTIAENKEENLSDEIQYEVVDEATEDEGDKQAVPTTYASNYRPTDEIPVGTKDVVSDLELPIKVVESQGSQVLQNPLPVSEIIINMEAPSVRQSAGGDYHRGREPVRQFERNSDPYKDRVQEEKFGANQQPHLLDQDWRDRSWDWNKEPVIHDYQHHAPTFLEEQSRNEDKDERYPSGMIHLPGNPFIGTVIDYGHGEQDQNPMPPMNARVFPSPHLGLEQHHFNDQDFRTPPPHFRMNNPEWIPPPLRTGFGTQIGLRAIMNREDPIIEKIPIDTLLLPPGRTLRPDHLVIMVRGLPGAGKTYLSKLIKEREIKEGGTVPRLLSLDDYFITEVEKVEEDPDSKKKVKKMVMEYEFDKSLEPSYKASFLKSFKKHIDDLYFTFIIIDATFDKKVYMDEFWSYAKSKGFQVYIVEVEADPHTCAKRNEHQRTLAEIQKIKDGWDETPRHYLQLDAQLLLQGHIEEVEMDNSSAILEIDVASQSKESEEGDDLNEPEYQKSKWELDTSEQHLDKLDGLKVVKKVTTMEEYLQVPEDYEQRSEESGKKRVRWADIEERKELNRMKELGFVVGFTDWKKLSDEDECIERALTKTKYI